MLVLVYPKRLLTSSLFVKPRYLKLVNLVNVISFLVYEKGFASKNVTRVNKVIKTQNNRLDYTIIMSKNCIIVRYR